MKQECNKQVNGVTLEYTTQHTWQTVVAMTTTRYAMLRYAMREQSLPAAEVVRLGQM